jgi:hypothetical protein
MRKSGEGRRPNSPFVAADILQNTSNMRPLIRLLASQAVKSWLAGNPPNTATSTTNDGNEGNDLRTV